MLRRTSALSSPSSAHKARKRHLGLRIASEPRFRGVRLAWAALKAKGAQKSQLRLPTLQVHSRTRNFRVLRDGLRCLKAQAGGILCFTGIMAAFLRSLSTSALMAT